MAIGPIYVGVVGAGFAGRSHVELFKQAKNVQLIAICDVDRERGKAISQEFDIPNIFTNYRKILEMTKLDAVSVAVPNVFHCPVTVAALQAGKHVLCEKPLATNAQSAAQMVEAAKKSGKVLSMMLQFRHSPASQLLKRQVEKGMLGKVYYAKASMLRSNAIPRGWFHVKKLSGGGPLFDLAPHILDVTWWFMGCPKPVSAFGATYSEFGPRGQGLGTWGVGYEEGSPDVEDLATGVVRFEGGQTIQIEVSWALHQKSGTQQVSLFGTEAGASLFPELQIFKQGKDESLSLPELPAAINPVETFLSSIRTGKPPVAPGSDGLQVMRMLDAIYKSAYVGKSVSI